MHIRRSLAAVAILAASVAAGPASGTAAAVPTFSTQTAAVNCNWNLDVIGGSAMHYKAGATFREGPYSECRGYKASEEGWANAYCVYYNYERGTKWFYAADWRAWVYSGNVSFPYGGEPTRSC